MESCHARKKGKTAEGRDIVETGLISSLRVQKEKLQLGKIGNLEGKNPGFGR